MLITITPLLITLIIPKPVVLVLATAIQGIMATTIIIAQVGVVTLVVFSVTYSAAVITIHRLVLKAVVPAVLPQAVAAAPVHHLAAEAQPR